MLPRRATTVSEGLRFPDRWQLLEHLYCIM
jgi:hypothetical protein